MSCRPLEARGEPGEPGWADVVTEKVTALVDPARDISPDLPSTLRTAEAGQLVGLLCAPILTGPTHA